MTFTILEFYLNDSDNGTGFSLLVFTPKNDKKPSNAVLAVTTKFIELFGINFEF